MEVQASRAAWLDQVVWLASALGKAGVRPRCRGAELVRHVYREHNKESDALAAKREETEEVFQPGLIEYWRLSFDGFYILGSGSGGLGWVLEGARPRLAHSVRDRESSVPWAVVALGSSPLARVSSSTEAELHAFREGLAFLFRVLGREPKRAALASNAPVKARKHM